MMASVSEQLLDALDDLDADELKRFKWYLKERKGFPIAALKKADATDTVDLMMKRFGPEEAVKIMVDILRKMNQNHLAEELESNHKQAQAEGSLESPALAGASSKPMEDIIPGTRNYFLQYSRQFTLDLNTVNKWLRLSEDNRVITGTDMGQSYPDHPDRFDRFNRQVLCRESVCGSSYWEIEWSGECVYIAVSYKSIRRKGRGIFGRNDGGTECAFGRNDQSWSLFCTRLGYLFRHDNKSTKLSVKPIGCRVGVYVDPSAGTLSFYSVFDTMSLIHTVQTTFTHTLYPGFGVNLSGSVKLC